MKLQIIKFAIVGLTSTIVHSLVYVLALRYIGATPQLSNSFGFLFALFASYFGHRFWTFNEVRMRHNHVSKLKFVVSALSSYGLNAIWVWIVENRTNMSPEYALIGIIFITPAITFLILKLWAFKDER